MFCKSFTTVPDRKRQKHFLSQKVGGSDGGLRGQRHQRQDQTQETELQEKIQRGQLDGRLPVARRAGT